VPNHGNVVVHFEEINSISSKNNFKTGDANMVDKDKFLHIIENFNDVIWTIDIKTSRFTYISGAVTKLLEYSVEEALAGVFDNHPNNNESYKATQLQIITEIEKLINSGKEYSDMKFEYQMPNKTGVQIWVETEIRILKEDGFPKEILGITRNIEERKKNDFLLQNYAKELERLNSGKDQFIKILAHDLRSPFNSMLGFSNNLLETFKEASKEELERKLKLINAQIFDSFQMLEDLLIWTKHKSAEKLSSFEDVYIADVSNDIIKYLASNFKNISVSYFESEKIVIRTDVYYLKAILRNLISNAIKYTNINGRILVSAIKSSGYVTINVLDNGIGMTEEQIENIWQNSKSAVGTNGEKGFGLGLVFCKELAEKLGGKLCVESKLGKGSNFKIRLPINNN